MAASLPPEEAVGIGRAVLKFAAKDAKKRQHEGGGDKKSAAAKSGRKSLPNRSKKRDETKRTTDAAECERRFPKPADEAKSAGTLTRVRCSALVRSESGASVFGKPPKWATMGENQAAP